MKFFVCPSTDPVDPNDQNYEANLIKYAKEIERAGADFLHADIMDGNFVERTTFGANLLKKIRINTSLPIDAHLMTKYDKRKLEEFIESGVNVITLHIENFIKNNKLKKRKILQAIDLIKQNNCLAGISLKPNTEEKFVCEIIKKIDLILIMSVEPGKSGQKFIEKTYSRVEFFNNLRENNKFNYLIEVDGGINPEISKKLRELKVDMVVSGNFVYSSDFKEQAIGSLKN